MSRFTNDKYNRLEAYVPGEQPQDKKYIKLNTNESPYPPAPGVIEAVLKEASSLNLYSDPECAVLRGVVAEEYGLMPENVFLSNGSDEILSFLFMALCPNGVAFPNISYGFYKVYAQLYGIDAKIVPLKDFRIDPNDYTNLHRTVVIANPNAPTGISLPISDIENIVRSNPDNVVCIDEAYVDFGGESAVSLVLKYPNLVALRTFSKSRSMAGARLGYCFAQADIIADLNKIKYSTNPYNINRMTLAAGVAAVKDREYFVSCRDKVISAREYLSSALEDIGFTVLPSRANFIFARSDRISGSELYLKLRENGILVRHFSSPELDDYNRITVGTLDDMQTLVKTVKDILQNKG